MQRNIQDSLLNSVRKDNIQVTLFLTNGFQIRGNVKGFDNYVIIVESEGKQQMIYKHAVSTIVPARAVTLSSDSDE
ncbi:MAG: RNA chaperone Hfq [Defluviitaleaceae bacterium]|nr:RNA chaperone Hfq [Defluviitaleaceae bacterium]